MAPLPNVFARFATHRHAVWPSLLAPDQLTRFHAYALLRGAIETEEDPESTPSVGRDFIMDGLLADLVPKVEAVTGLALFPTYSYFRVYRHGDVLAKHSDRPSCEISLTLCLGYVGARTWPIGIEGPLGTARVELLPGDALLYRGIECPHWRDAFDGESAAQVFLHYVDRHGPHAEWKFDKRPSLATFPFTCGR